jgi:glycosyltransferase involved in cell wall biosynthesis
MLKTIYDRILIQTISHLSHRIVCLTDDLKRVLVRRGLNEWKVVVIPNAMHVKELQSQVSNLKDDAHFDSGFDLLFVGRLEERKGAQHLLKALSILNEEGLRPTLKIVGEGIYRHKLASFAKQNDLSSQVIFSGYISHEELLESYLRARCVVIPSLQEGTPGVAIEAFALGKPVIATSIPGMEVMSSKKLGFVVPPGDCEALAEAIRKSLSIGDDELHRIENEAKKLAEQYDWSYAIKQFLWLYQDCRENKT